MVKYRNANKSQNQKRKLVKIPKQEKERRQLGHQRQKKQAKFIFKKSWKQSGTRFEENMTKSYIENKILFYGTWKRLKKNKEHNMKNI